MWLNPGETRNERPAQQTSAGFAAAANARGARGPRRSCAEHTLSPSPFPGPAAPQRDTEGPTRPEREAAGARRLPGAAAVTAASRGSPAPGAQQWSAEHACMHTNRQTHTHVHTYTQTYTCMHTRAHTQTHMCTHTSPATHSANHSANHSATHSDTRLSLCTRKAAASEGHANDS